MTDFGLSMLQERYFLHNEDKPEQLFRRVASIIEYPEMRERIVSYMEKEWFMPSTPELANLGSDRGLPISCFLNEVEDSKEGIFDVYMENFHLGAGGGGIGTDWSAVREINAPVGKTGTSSGIIPFIKVSDSSTLAVSQGGLRRASQAVYLDVSHPEIEEFIEVRKPTGADLNRRCLNIHHGVKLSDEFMEAVKNDKPWNLVSPKDGRVVKTISAFDLFVRILTTRIENGEPYIFFTDNANKYLPDSYIENRVGVTMSNLCTEIMQYTDTDRTAVCALASVNLLKWDEWKDDEMFLSDVLYFQDTVLDVFLAKADPVKYAKAIKSVKEERNVGIGVMGWHSLLQSKLIPFSSAIASGLNRKIFQHIHDKLNEASKQLGILKGTPLMGSGRRNNLMMAIAPTSSISIICGEVSPGIEPELANVYMHKNIAGTTVRYNQHLDRYLREYTMQNGLDEAWVEAQWKAIVLDEGSVQNLDWMDSQIKAVFETAYEIDQRWIIEHASVRQPWVDQGQSVNIFLPGDIHKQYLFDIHMMAHTKGLKSLYYCRSTAPQKAKIGDKVEREVIQQYDECLSCQ